MLSRLLAGSPSEKSLQIVGYLTHVSAAWQLLTPEITIAENLDCKTSREPLSYFRLHYCFTSLVHFVYHLLLASAVETSESLASIPSQPHDNGSHALL